MEDHFKSTSYATWLLDKFDIVTSIICVVIIGVIGAFLRKISSSSTKHQCTSSTYKSSLKTSPQSGKRQGSVTFAEGTKFEELNHHESVSFVKLLT